MRRLLVTAAVAAGTVAPAKAEAHYWAHCKKNPCKRHVVRPNLGWLNPLAHCESTDNPRAVSAGGAYRGLYQFDFQTWNSVGGLGDPINASRLEQSFRAVILRARRGMGPWPVCGR